MLPLCPDPAKIPQVFEQAAGHPKWPKDQFLCTKTQYWISEGKRQKTPCRSQSRVRPSEVEIPVLWLQLSFRLAKEGTLACISNGVVSKAKAVIVFLYSVFMRVHLKSSGQFCALLNNKEIEVLELVQIRATELGKGLECKTYTGAAEGTEVF